MAGPLGVASFHGQTIIQGDDLKLLEGAFETSKGFLCTEEITLMYIPEGPSTQYSRTLVPNTIKGIVLGPET